MAGSFIDPGFPDAIAEYAHAVAARYRGAHRRLHPAERAAGNSLVLWATGYLAAVPERRSWLGAVVVSVMTGVQSAMRAIREADAEAEIVHVEAVQAYQTEDASLAGEVLLWARRAQLPTRLLLGYVCPEDEDWSWLVRNGVDLLSLERLREGAERPDASASTITRSSRAGRSSGWTERLCMW